MKLTQMDLELFAEKLASKEPAPGGGSVAAYSAVTGVALLEMVARLTTGKKKYAQHEELVLEIITEAGKLRKLLIGCVDEDTNAYNEVSNVFTMPKETDEEKSIRSEAMEKALKNATLVPLSVMGFCQKALEVAKTAVGTTNLSAASDLGVCALNLEAGLKGAMLNVLINLDGIKDEKFKEKIMNEATLTENQGTELANEIYNGVRKK